jgi:hypothetical protein
MIEFLNWTDDHKWWTAGLCLLLTLVVYEVTCGIEKVIKARRR